MRWSRWIHALPARCRAVLWSRRVEKDLHDELSFHLAMQTQANLQRGMSEVEANRRARQALGGVEQVKERSRDARPLRWARDFVDDLRYVRRSFRRHPGFAVIAVLTLALGIGANTAMFSVLNTFLFRPLPYPDSERLVELFRTSVFSQRLPYSAANFLDQRQRNDVLEHMAAYNGISPSFIQEDESAERLQGMAVSADFFPALGAQAALGRAFTVEEDQPGHLVTVLSDRFWQTRFGGDPNIVGRTLLLDGERVKVIGVMRAGFDHPLLWGQVDLWRPLAFTAEQRQNRGNNYLRVFGRLKPGVSLPQAQDAMVTLAANLSTETSSNRNESLRLEPLQRSVVGRSMPEDVGRRVMWFTFGLAGCVLLIACANLANLQLVRTTARVRELRTRAALGAERFRLFRQSLTESLVVAVVGGMVGLLVAYGGVAFVSRRLFGELPGAHVTVDLSVFGFALMCSVLTGLVFGTIPSVLASRADVNQALTVRAEVSTRSPHRWRHALIVGEVAFALVLLAGAGLFLRGLQRHTQLGPGWRVDGLLTGQLDLRGANYATPAQRLTFYQHLEERLRARPGIQDVALSWSLPVWGFNSSGGVIVEGQAEPPPGQYPEVFFEQVSLRYFDTLGLRLVAGRSFDSADVAGRPQVAIINEGMARRFWPRESAIGKRYTRLGNRNWIEVVGVVSDVGFPGDLGDPRTRLQAFRPLAQAIVPGVNVTVRTAGEPDMFASDLRRAVAELDATQPVQRIRTMRSLVERGLGSISMLATLLGAFAALGLILAAIGIYGVTSYSVAQRTGEFGIRMALGARAADVLWLVLAKGAGVILSGALLGVGGGYTVSRLLIAAIPNLPTRDPAALLAIALVLFAVALVACYVPARRATKVSPLTALRYE